MWTGSGVQSPPVKDLASNAEGGKERQDPFPGSGSSSKGNVVHRPRSLQPGFCSMESKVRLIQAQQHVWVLGGMELPNIKVGWS